MAAQETASQTALRNSAKEVRGKDSIYVILVKGSTRSQTHTIKHLLTLAFKNSSIFYFSETEFGFSSLLQ